MAITKVVIFLILAAFAGLATCQFIGKLSKKNEFGMVYQLKETDSDRYRYLEIECRSFQVLSVRVRESKQSY